MRCNNRTFRIPNKFFCLKLFSTFLLTVFNQNSKSSFMSAKTLGFTALAVLVALFVYGKFIKPKVEKTA